MSGKAPTEPTTRRVEINGANEREGYTYATEEDAIRARDELQTEIFGQLERILARS